MIKIVNKVNQPLNSVEQLKKVKKTTKPRLLLKKTTKIPLLPKKKTKIRLLLKRWKKSNFTNKKYKIVSKIYYKVLKNSNNMNKMKKNTWIRKMIIWIK